MSDFLIQQIKSYLETHPKETAVAVERRAKVPGATITKITQGSRPRVDRLAQLLTGVDPEIAAEWLRAYLLDDVPDAYTRNVRVAVDPLTGSSTRLDEKPVSTHADKFTRALERMRASGQGDDEIAQWFIDSVNLILGDEEAAAHTPAKGSPVESAIKHPVQQAVDDITGQFSQSKGENVNKKNA